MKHYSELEWLALKQRSVKEPETELMENHLRECDQCMNLFLNLTNELESARIDRCIPPNFSQTTMAFINNNQVSHFPTNHRRQSKMRRLLSYYVAAAAVTLMLVSSGVFQAAVSDAVWTTANSTINIETKDNIIFNWPSRLIETSSSWTHLIPKENILLKEVKW